MAWLTSPPVAVKDEDDAKGGAPCKTENGAAVAVLLAAPTWP